MKNFRMSSVKKLYATKTELLLFLRLLGTAHFFYLFLENKTNLITNQEMVRFYKTYFSFNEKIKNMMHGNIIIQEFLQYDKYFCLADKYLIAMVFIYFKRAHLRPEEYTHLNFFAGLCIAHSMEEDVELTFNIYPWALGKNIVKSELSELLELKDLLWQAMDYRAAVSHHCCTQLISCSQNHPIWQRERKPSFFRFYVSKALNCSPKTLRKSTARKLDISKNNIKTAR